MIAALRYPRLFASLVKIEHTVFALPFAYVGAFLAVDGVPSGPDVLWITLAMVGARSLAMALNRLIDAGIDARNPRTAGRELPRGVLTPVQVGLFSAASLALFLVAVYQLAPLVRWLWPIAVAVWVAGFDLLYALFDLDVDRAQGLHSLPARFGPPAAIWAARACHAATVALLAVAGLGLPVGPLYWLGVAAVAGLLAYEHSLVSPRDWRRLDMAFFTMNGVISLAFFACVLAEVLV
jgi:4-hydroxybenzoate polyprenyltransferase